MKPKIIFLIRSNPLESHRPAEAIRIATGLGVGKHTVKIILSAESPRILSPDEEDLIDIEILEKFLPYMEEWHIPLLVDSLSLAHIDLSGSSYKFSVIQPDKSQELLAGGHCIFIF